MLLAQELWLDLFWLLWFNIQVAVLRIFWNKPLHPFALLLLEILSKCTFFLGFHISMQIQPNSLTMTGHQLQKPCQGLRWHCPSTIGRYLYGKAGGFYEFVQQHSSCEHSSSAVLPSPPGWAEPSPAALQPKLLVLKQVRNAHVNFSAVSVVSFSQTTQEWEHLNLPQPLLQWSVYHYL